MSREIYEMDNQKTKEELAAEEAIPLEELHTDVEDRLSISSEKEGRSEKRQNWISFALSVFNLMNAILGSGILGLAEALKNVGIVPFILMMMLTGALGSYTINMLLHMSNLIGVKTYENLSEKAFGKIGKLLTTVIIILHCYGAMCSYVFIIKEELPEFMKAVLKHEEGMEEPLYLNETFLMLMVVVFIIVPLATMKNIKFLGYSSALAMSCMILFTITVVAKKFEIPCPLTSSVHDNTTNEMLNSTTHHVEETEQSCEPRFFTFNSRSAYAVPTMFFSFMCHASMLSIYDELRSPSIKRMQSVANVSILLVMIIYISAAMFGYFTFFDQVKSELLLTYSMANPHDPFILISRFMVIICVTLSVPLLHFPARKTIILTFCRNPQDFSWLRHICIMFVFISTTVLMVLFIPDIRDIFGFAGATTSTCLLVIFPSLFVIKLTGSSNAEQQVTKTYQKRRMFAWFLLMVGVTFMVLSTAMIILDHVKGPASAH